MADVTRAVALHDLTAAQAARLIRARQVSPVELVEQLLARAAELDPRVQAWVSLDAERALAAARTAEQAAQHGVDLPSLHGVPFGAKDIYDSFGLRTSAGFRPYANRIPTTDAVPIALGSQTAGSILRPAAYNGVVGFKPTYGRISKRGVFPLAWTLDHVGLLARSVEDCGLFLTAVAGHDPADPSSANQALPLLELDAEPPAPRLGLVREAVHFAAPRMGEHLTNIATQFAAAGAQVVELSLG